MTRLPCLVAPDPDHVTAQVLRIPGLPQHRVVRRRGGQGHARHLADPQLGGQGRAGPCHLVLPAPHQPGPGGGCTAARSQSSRATEDGQTEDRTASPVQHHRDEDDSDRPEPTQDEPARQPRPDLGPGVVDEAPDVAPAAAFGSSPTTGSGRPRRRHSPPHRQRGAEQTEQHHHRSSSRSSSARQGRVPPGRRAVNSTARSVCTNPVVGCPHQHRDLAHPAHPGLIPADVDHRMQRGRELSVQRVPVQSAQGRQGLQAGRDIGRRVGVHGPAPALMAGVQRRQQIADLPRPGPRRPPAGPAASAATAEPGRSG